MRSGEPLLRDRRDVRREIVVRNREGQKTGVGSGNQIMRRSAVHRSQRRRGAAVVEMALIVPWVFLFIFGMIEVSRAIMVQQTVVNAAREGARAASLATTYSDTNGAVYVDNLVRDFLKRGAVPAATANDPAKVPVTINPPLPAIGTSMTGTPMTVTVTINNYSDVSWLPGNFPLLGALTSAQISESVTRNRE